MEKFISFFAYFHTKCMIITAGKIKIKSSKFVCSEMFAKEAHSGYTAAGAYIFRKKNYDAM